MIVATDNLSKEYDGVYRVQELDIRIKEGDIYGFLGPNGAGKSTTMKMLLGLVKPTSGTIEIMGKPFNEKTRRDILSSVGSLIESPSYYGHLTGRENMEIIRRLLDLPKKNIEEAVHIVRHSSTRDRDRVRERDRDRDKERDRERTPRPRLWPLPECFPDGRGTGRLTGQLSHCMGPVHRKAVRVHGFYRQAVSEPCSNHPVLGL